MTCLLCKGFITWKEYIVKGGICDECFITRGEQDADSKEAK